VPAFASLGFPTRNRVITTPMACSRAVSGSRPPDSSTISSGQVRIMATISTWARGPHHRLRWAVECRLALARAIAACDPRRPAAWGRARNRTAGCPAPCRSEC